MTINLGAPQTTELKPRIVVVGVGGAGGNAVNNMIGQGLSGVEFIVANTDAQALNASKADRRIQLGVNITQGLGCGARPEVGRESAEEAIEQIVDHLQGTHMAFITAGMGGGTGTGAAPVIARACREQGMLTVGVVTKPFQFEGTTRMRLAERGIEELQKHVDTLIVIPNQNLFRIANEKTTFAAAFAMADQVLHSGVRGITDLMVVPGLINLDFADVKTVMSEMGKAMMGTGEADGDDRSVAAAEAAIANPLLDDVSIKGARGVLINITGGMDLTLHEVDEAANRIRDAVDPDANIIVGAALDETLEGRVRVSVVATGIDLAHAIEPREETAGSKVLAFGVGNRPRGPAPRPVSLGGGAGGAATARVLEPPAPAEAAPVAAGVEMPAQASMLQPMLPAVEPVRAAAVPEPKPLTPEPEVLAARPASAVAEPRHDPYVPPRAIEPKADLERLPVRPQPQPAAEAPSDPASAATRRASLIQRMTGSLFGSTPAAPATEPRRAEPQFQPAREPAPAAERRPEPPLEVSARPAAMRTHEETDLDIPSFLRRPAN